MFMAKMTSAYANKVLKKLQDDKSFWLSKERDGYLYVAAIDEEPVIPEYDYNQISDEIKNIDWKIVKIKHAINVINSTSEIEIGDESMTIDQILISMAQLNNRRSMLDNMRKQQEKRRVDSGFYGTRKTAPEYQYVNYSIDEVKKDYEEIDSKIAAMQIALDKFNQTFEFDVEW
jgi:hypothetical protein